MRCLSAKPAENIIRLESPNHRLENMVRAFCVFYSLSLWERVRVRGLAREMTQDFLLLFRCHVAATNKNKKTLVRAGTLTPALSQRERGKLPLLVYISLLLFPL
jgi:hypothetical protein